MALEIFQIKLFIFKAFERLIAVLGGPHMLTESGVLAKGFFKTHFERFALR